MDFKQLDRGEVIATAGGVLLAISIFLPWYSLGNANAALGGCHGPHTSCSAWNALSVIRVLLLLAAFAPVILAWIIIRGHALSWPRGEMTAIIAIAALTFIVFRGIVYRPGTPPGEISISYGWWIGLAGGFLILIGSLWRAQESAIRKPPGLP